MEREGDGGTRPHLAPLSSLINSIIRPPFSGYFQHTPSPEKLQEESQRVFMSLFKGVHLK